MDSSSPLDRSTRDSSANRRGSTSLSHRPSPRQTHPPESPSPNLGDAPIPDDEHGADLPMNMSASVMLTGLPRDAHQALADVEAIDAGKGKLHTRLDIFHKALHCIPLALNCIGKEILEPVHPTDLTDDPSYRALSTSPVSPDSQESSVQGQRIAKVRNCGQVPSQEAGLQRYRLGLLLRQQRLCARSGRGCRWAVESTCAPSSNLPILTDCTVL